MKSLEEADKLVVVKFARRYCLDAHTKTTCRDVARTPTILPQAHGGGSLRDHGIHGSNRGYRKKAEHIESLRRAVQALHDGGMVFGDLRGPNVLIAGDGVKLVDFDLSGKEGMVRYPDYISMEIKWPKGVESLGKIEGNHDKAWFQRLTGTEVEL